jgi:hypothetical protein
MEELIKFTLLRHQILDYPVPDHLTDRYSEHKEAAAKLATRLSPAATK